MTEEKELKVNIWPAGNRDGRELAQAVIEDVTSKISPVRLVSPKEPADCTVAVDIMIADLLQIQSSHIIMVKTILTSQLRLNNFIRECHHRVRKHHPFQPSLETIVIRENDEDWKSRWWSLNLALFRLCYPYDQ